MNRTALLPALAFTLGLPFAAAAQTAPTVQEGPLVQDDFGNQWKSYDIPAGKLTLRFLENQDISFIDTLQILDDESVVIFESYFEAFSFMVTEPTGEDGVLPLGLDVDATGDGRPDFVLQSYSGGAHCCFYTLIIEREPEVMVLAELDGGHSEVRLQNLDSDPALEATLLDWTFAYWKTSFAESPAPQVVLKLDENGYNASAALMRGPAPDAAEIAALAKDAREAMVEAQTPTSLLWGPMLEFIYRGQADSAFALLDQAWPADLPGRDAFVLQLGAQLSWSPYWMTIAEMNGWGSNF